MKPRVTDQLMTAAKGLAADMITEQQSVVMLSDEFGEEERYVAVLVTLNPYVTDAIEDLLAQLLTPEGLLTLKGEE